MYKSRKTVKFKLPANGFLLINHNKSQKAERIASECIVLKIQTP